MNEFYGCDANGMIQILGKGARSGLPFHESVTNGDILIILTYQRIILKYVTTIWEISPIRMVLTFNPRQRLATWNLKRGNPNQGTRRMMNQNKKQKQQNRFFWGGADQLWSKGLCFWSLIAKQVSKQSYPKRKHCTGTKQWIVAENGRNERSSFRFQVGVFFCLSSFQLGKRLRCGGKQKKLYWNAIPGCYLRSWHKGNVWRIDHDDVCQLILSHSNTHTGRYLLLVKCHKCHNWSKRNFLFDFLFLLPENDLCRKKR